MLQAWTSLGAEGQAAIIGLLLAALFYVGRFAFPAWFASQTNVDLFKRTAAAVIGALALTTGNLATGGWKGVVPFLVAWAVAFATAEGVHTVAARTTALRAPK